MASGTATTKTLKEITFGFDAPLLNSLNDFKAVVEEIVPGGRDDQDIAFTASGSNFTMTPIDNIRITYNNTSSETDLYQRYSVTVPVAGGDDTHHPAVLSFALSRRRHKKDLLIIIL